MADRWECSQATGLPAWRHQDLHTQRIGHTVSRALKQKNLYLGTGPSWTLCKNMQTATQGAFVVDWHPIGGKKQSTLQRWADKTEHTEAHILEGRKSKASGVKRRVNTLWTERQTTPRLG